MIFKIFIFRGYTSEEESKLNRSKHCDTGKIFECPNIIFYVNDYSEDY